MSFFLLKWKQYGALTDFHHSVIFSSGFSVLPQKISAHLRDDSSLDANTRKMRSVCNILYISGLYFVAFGMSCNKHHFSTWYGPYQGLKRSILHPEIDVNGGWYGHYQNARWIIPDYATGNATMLYMQKWLLLSFVWRVHTYFFRFYFVKIKSRKIVSSLPEFSLKTIMSGIQNRTWNMLCPRGEDLSFGLMWIYYYVGKCTVTVYTSVQSGCLPDIQ